MKQGRFFMIKTIYNQEGDNFSKQKTSELKFFL